MSQRSRTAGPDVDATGFRRLLSRLDPDPERAGEAYEDLRRTLWKFFTWRGALRPEECADETLDRVARKLEEGVAIEAVRNFAYGVARLVFLESTRSPDNWSSQEPADLERAVAPAAPDDGLAACLDGCLDALPHESRALILAYYTAERRVKIDNRVELARELGLSPNALRSRAQRIRERLERCMRECLEPGEGRPGPARHETVIQRTTR